MNRRIVYTPLPTQPAPQDSYIELLCSSFRHLVTTDAVLNPYVDYWARGGMNESPFIELPDHGGAE